MSTRITRSAAQRANTPPKDQPTILTAFNAPPPPPQFTKQDPPPITTRPKTSGIWEYAADLDEHGRAPFSKVAGKENCRIYICKLCRAAGKKQDTIYECSGGNGAFRTHLSKNHRVTVLTTMETAMENHAAEIESARVDGLWNNNVRVVAKCKRSDFVLCSNGTDLTNAGPHLT